MADVLLNNYDLYYTEPGATQLGFMLAKNKNGTKLWRRDEESGLPESFAYGDIAYANLAPDIQKVIAHRFFNGGLGALEFEVEDDAAFQTLRYLRSQNIDCRSKGKAYPGPKIVAVAADTPSAPVIENADFENWSGGVPVDWTYTEDESTCTVGSINEDATHFQSGAKSARMDLVYSDAPGDNPSNFHLEQTIANPTYYIGHTIQISIYNKLVRSANNFIDTIEVRLYRNDVDVASASFSTVAHDYGIGTTTAYVVPTGTTSLKVKLWVYCNTYPASDETAEIYWDLAASSITLFALGIPVAFAVFNGELYLATSTGMFKLNGAGTAWLARKSFAGITDIKSFPTYLYIALGAANFYYYMSTAEVFTLGNKEKADLFCQDGTDFWLVDWPYTVQKSTDPTNTGAWGGAITVGESSYNIRDIKTHDGIIHCLKEEGVFSVTSAGVVTELFPELRSIQDTDGGRYSEVFRDGLYFRMGVQQVWEIKDSVLTEVTPELSSPGISQYAYECVAFTSDESWLYAIMKRGASDLVVLAGRWEYISGLTRWIWHEIRSIDLTGVGPVHVCSVEGRPFLYIASTTVGEGVYKLYLPVTNDATADGGYRFHTAGSLWSPRYMSLLFAIEKRWINEYMRSVSLTGTNYINVYYSTDDGATWALLHKFDTSPEQTETFTNKEATMMNLRFDFVGDSETVPPVLKYHNLKALTLMPSVTRFRHTIRCADGLTLKKNHKASSNYTASAIRTFVDALRDEVCTLGDRWGAEHTVKVKVAQEIEVFDEDTQKPETLFTIEATKL